MGGMNNDYGEPREFYVSGIQPGDNVSSHDANEATGSTALPGGTTCLMLRYHDALVGLHSYDEG